MSKKIMCSKPFKSYQQSIKQCSKPGIFTIFVQNYVQNAQNLHKIKRKSMCKSFLGLIARFADL